MDDLLSGDKSYNPVAASAFTFVQPTPALVNLNEVVSKSLLTLHDKVKKLKAIIRQDFLPVVKGSEVAFTQVFHTLYGSIINYPPGATKLFIYTRCEKEVSEVMDMSLPEGFENYRICIYTNITTDAGWQQTYCPAIEEVKSILKSNNAQLSCQDITNTGCLYVISLPGKLQ